MPSRRFQNGFVWLALSLIAAACTTVTGYVLPGTHDPIISSLIWTGRLAFLVFLIPLFARPLRSLIKNNFTATLIRWRRTAGIVYGGIQSVHLVIVMAMFYTMETTPTEAVMVIVGAIGLILALAMLVTSFPAPTRAVGPENWKRIHNSGFYVFMFIYSYDFIIDPFLQGTPESHLPWALLTALGIAMRVVARAFNSTRKPSLTSKAE